MMRFVSKFLFGRTHRPAKAASRRAQRPTKKSRLTVRALEDRTLLSAGSFLQGTAFIDLHHDATLQPNDPYLAGATISLYQGTTVAGAPLATTTTNSNGAYLFTDANVLASYGNAGLNPGVYTLVETPPTGIVNTGTQVLSQLNPATSINASTIQVTLLDPSSLYFGFNSTVFFNRHAWDYLQETVLGSTAKESAGQYPVDAFGSLTPVLTIGGAGVTNGSAKVTLSNTSGLSVGQFVQVTDGTTTLYSPIRSITTNTSITLQDKWTGSTGNTATVGLLSTVNSPFLTLCWDLQHFLTDGTNIFQVTPTSGQGNPANSGQIAYLYNHYGTVDIKNAAADNAVLSQATVPTPALPTGSIAEAVGLQVAIWELEYGASFSALQVLKRNGSTTPAVLAQELSDINTWANFYTADAAGKSEVATFLQVTGAPIQGGQQGILATGSYNFANLGQPILATLASQTAGGVVGSAVISDQATLTGGFQIAAGNPAPTLTFQLIAPDGTTAYTETQTVTGTGTYTTTGTGVGSELATQVGLYYWVVSYSGNAFNNAVTDNGLTDVTEQVTTTLATPTLTTIASQTANGVVGTAVVSDSATLSGGFQIAAGAPAPTLVFTLIAPDGTTAYTETQTVTGMGTYTTTGTGAGSELATQVGLYYWVVSYSGNAFNNSVTDNGLTDLAEQVTTTLATPTLTTTATQTAGGAVGTAIINDSATLAGGFQIAAGAPAPTLVFTLIAPDGTTAYTETQTVTGTGIYTTTGTGTGSELAIQVGLYYWVVSYSGNAFNNAVTDNGLTDVTEQVTTALTTPTLTTTASQTALGVVGTAVISDSATLSGGFQVAAGMPAPTLVFQLIAPDGTTVYAETQTVTGTGTYTTTGTGAGSELATQVGLYYWLVTYSGNAFNNAVTDNGLTDVAEQVTTTLATPTLTTTASQTAGGVVGTAVVNDSATLTGGFQVDAGAPAPTLVFTLIAPDGTTAYTETQTVTGTGTYTTTGTGTGSELATQVGLYYWVVSYSGNTFNNAVTDNGLTDVAEQVTTVAAALSDLRIAKTDNVGGTFDPATNNTTGGVGIPGNPLTYTIVVTNDGPATAVNVPVDDTFPAALLNVSWTGTDGSAGNGNLIDTIASLAAGASVTYTVTATIDPAATGTIVNTATVTWPPANGDNTQADNTSTDTITLTPQADLRIQKTDNVGGTFNPATNNTTGGTATPGKTVVTYTIVVTNDGPSTAVNQTVTDTFPAALRNVTWTGTDGSSGTGNLSDTIATLVPAATVTYTVTASINPAATGNLSNTAAVTAPPGDNTPANNTSTDVIALVPEADLAVTKTSPWSSAYQGTSIYFTITVTNRGPSTVTAFYLVDTLPSGFVNVTFHANTGQYNTTTHRWSGLNLTTGHTITLTVNGMVALTATGTLVNVVHISAPANPQDTSFFVDTNPNNNAAQASVIVLALSKRYFI